MSRGGFFVENPNPTKKNPNPGNFKFHGIFTKKCRIPIPKNPKNFRKFLGFWEFPKNPKYSKKMYKINEIKKCKKSRKNGDFLLLKIQVSINWSVIFQMLWQFAPKSLQQLRASHKIGKCPSLVKIPSHKFFMFYH